MDSHTKRIVSTTGLFHADPMLPPVRNMGVVYLDEPLTEKEIVLHDAKKALKDLEDGIKQGLDMIGLLALQTKLKKALYALRGERQYFVKRYVVTNKLVMNPGPSLKPSTTEEAADAAEQEHKEAKQRKRQASAAAAEARQKVAAQVLKDEDAARELEEKADREPDMERQQFLRKRRQVEIDEANERADAAEERIKAVEEAAQAELDAADEASDKAEEAFAEEEDAADAAEAAAEAEDWAQQMQDAYYAADRADIAAAKKATTAAEARADAEKAEKAARAVLQRAKKAAADAEAAEAARRKAAAAAANANAEHDWYANEGWLKTWRVVDVRGDGDCLLRALCHFHDKGNDNCHTGLRQKIVEWMIANLGKPVLNGLTVKGIINMGLIANPVEQLKVRGGKLVTPKDADDYLRRMSEPGTYCTQLELSAYEKFATATVRVVIRDLPQGPAAVGIVSNPPPFQPLVGDETFYVYYDAASEHYKAMERRKG